MVYSFGAWVDFREDTLGWMYKWRSIQPLKYNGDSNERQNRTVDLKLYDQVFSIFLVMMSLSCDHEPCWQ